MIVFFELSGEVRRRASANFGRTHRIFEGVQTGRGAFSGRGVTANWGTLGDTAGVIAAGIWLSTHFFFRAAVSLCLWLCIFRVSTCLVNLFGPEVSERGAVVIYFLVTDVGALILFCKEDFGGLAGK